MTSNNQPAKPVGSKEDELRKAKLDLEIGATRRKNIDGWIGFWTAKVAGVSGVVVAASELLDPQLIPGHIDPTFAGFFGLSLLVGKKVVGLVAKATEQGGAE